MKITIALLFSMIWMATGVANAQSPYELNRKKELTYLASGSALLGLGVFLESQTEGLTLEQLDALNPDDVNGFDRFATDNYSTSGNTMSDYILLGSHASPLIFLATKKGHDHYGDIATLYIEAYLINTGITSLVKYSVRRARPFAYNSEVDDEERMKRGTRASFISGHTSQTAVNTFFAAKVFSDLYPKSKWKPVVWGVAAIIPAATGYFRVKAGKHFPTDTMAGYTVGALTGILVPHFHKNKTLQEKGLSFQAGVSGMRMNWTF